MKWEELIGKPVKVVWEDPETVPGWVIDPDGEAYFPPIYSYGVLLKVTEKAVLIASTEAPEHKQVADVGKFPTGCVLDIIEVEDRGYVNGN